MQIKLLILWRQKAKNLLQKTCSQNRRWSLFKHEGFPILKQNLKPFPLKKADICFSSKNKITLYIDCNGILTKGKIKQFDSCYYLKSQIRWKTLFSNFKKKVYATKFIRYHPLIFFSQYFAVTASQCSPLCISKISQWNLLYKLNIKQIKFTVRSSRVTTLRKKAFFKYFHDLTNETYA